MPSPLPTFEGSIAVQPVQEPPLGVWELVAENVGFPARSDFAATSYGGTHYVLGGEAGGRMLADVWSSENILLDYFDVLEMLRLLRVRALAGRQEMNEDLVRSEVNNFE